MRRALSIASVVVMAVGAMSTWAVAAPAGAPRRAAHRGCADVLFIGARGSGEAGPGTSRWRASRGDPYGLGAPVNSAYRQLMKDLAGRRTVQVMSVHYAANGVQTIGHAPREYFHNLAAGVRWAKDRLLSQARSCPEQEIVLAGYSQGAMVMHRTLHDLERTSAGARVLSRLAGAILVGDGDQVPGDNELRYGSAPRDAMGVGFLFPKLSHSADVKFRRDLRGVVLRVCNKHDPVCDITPLAPWDPLLVKIHLSYPGSKPLLAAANHVAAMVRKVPAPAPDTVRLTAVAGTPLRHQLAADIAPGYRLLWGVLPPAVMPAGLTLSKDGLVSGIPATAGSFTTLIRVRSVRRRYLSRWVPATLKVTVTTGTATWTPAEANLPANAVDSDAGFASLACASASACTAVGYYTDNSGIIQGLLLSGSQDQPGSWAPTEAPLPAGADPTAGGSVLSVACPSASVCAAVGGYFVNDYPNGEGNAAMLLSRSGSTWTPSQIMPPANAATSPAQARPGSIACQSPTYCVATGDYSAVSGQDQGWIASGDPASSWAAAEAPVPAGVPSTTWRQLDGVACTTKGCVAVGWYADPSSPTGERGMLVTGSGASWTALAVPLPASYTGDSALAWVACQAAGPCTAATFFDSNEPGMITTGWGSSWTSQQAPLPAGGDPYSTIFFSVACPPTSACTVAGWYDDSSTGIGHGLLETWSGTSWTPVETPLPPGTVNSIGGPTWDSCPSSAACYVAGYTKDSSGNFHPIMLSGSGTSWTAAALPLPAGAAGLYVQQGDGPFVTCVSASQCVAAGTYTDSAGNQQGLLLSGPG